MFVLTNCCWRLDGKLRWKSRIIWKQLALDIVHSLLFFSLASTRTFLLELVFFLFNEYCLKSLESFNIVDVCEISALLYWNFLFGSLQVISLWGLLAFLKLCRVNNDGNTNLWRVISCFRDWLSRHTTCGLFCRWHLLFSGLNLCSLLWSRCKKKIVQHFRDAVSWRLRMKWNSCQNNLLDL